MPLYDEPPSINGEGEKRKRGGGYSDETIRDESDRIRFNLQFETDASGEQGK